jgi:hypothetical protein
MTDALKRRAARDASAAHYNAPMTPISAQSADELWTAKGVDGAGEYRFFSFAGSRGPVTWRNIVFGWIMEMLAAVIITLGVGLGRWYDSGDNVINALILATFSGVSFYVATRLPQDDKLPIQGNGLFVAGHMATLDVGFWGFWLYTSAQYVGCILAGGLGLGYMVSGLVRTNTHNLIPIPITTGANPTSLTTVVLLELFFGAFWLVAVLLKEFLNTETSGQTPSKGRNAKNYSKAQKLGAFTLFWLVLLGYQFGVYTFSNVSYVGPLFAGTHDYVDALGAIGQQINLDSAIFTDSVFGTGGVSGRAYMFYTLVVYAAAFIGSAIFYAFFFAGKRLGSHEKYANEGPGMKYMQEPVGSSNSGGSGAAYESPLSMGSASGGRLSSPLNPKGSAQ